MLRRGNSEDGDDIEQGGNLSNSAEPLLGTADESLRGTTADPLNYLRAILFSNYVHVLFIFLPFGLASGALGWSPGVVFLTNCFAMIPLASLLSFATEDLSKGLGQGLGGLLNVTFGNATELIVGIVALKQGQVKLIQTAMLGSVLSSLLFVISGVLTLAYKLGARTVFCSWRDTNDRVCFQ